MVGNFGSGFRNDADALVHIQCVDMSSMRTVQPRCHAHINRRSAAFSLFGSGCRYLFLHFCFPPYFESRAKKSRAAKILQGRSAYNPLYFLYKISGGEMFLRFEIFSKYFSATKKAVPEALPESLFIVVFYEFFVLFSYRIDVLGNGAGRFVPKRCGDLTLRFPVL